MFEEMLTSFHLLLRFDTFLMIGIGLVLGILIGALPGFSTVMAMAVLLPISFFLEPLVGIPFLIGVFKGGIYGGSIPAILVGIPGTGASVATVIDGLPMMKNGQSRKALDIALVASALGDGLGSLITLFLIGPIAVIALKVGPPELAMILVLSMLAIVATDTGHPAKGFVMLLVGMFFAMIGQDPIGALPRFNFGFPSLAAGIDLLPLLIGLFALPEILLALENKEQSAVKGSNTRPGGDPLRLRELKSCLRTILRSTGIGVGIGMIPGVGQIVAAFLGYAAAKTASSHPETFGKGDIEGVAAPEAANNAVNGPAMVPLLTLGIPGDNVTAILLGAFVAQGLRPGPQLFEQQGTLVYAILISMVVACVLLLVVGYALLPIMSRVVTIPRAYLVPLTLLFAFAGTYVYRSNIMDIYFMIAFGVFGYAARKFDFGITPLVMAFILTPALEYAFGQTVTLSNGDVFGYILTERPIAAGVVIMIPMIMLLMLRRSFLRRRALKTAGIPSEQAR
jgi:putative tricarboxylic transport membrane protein